MDVRHKGERHARKRSRGPRGVGTKGAGHMISRNESRALQRITSGRDTGEVEDREALKRDVAEVALGYVCPDDIIGVGAGSTVEHFIRALARSGMKPRGAIPASERTRTLLEAHGMPVVCLAEEIMPLALYIDGADEADAQLRLIKGGGGAHTREKVLASAAQLFVCIVDESKMVDALGRGPVPVEVVPVALSLVERELRRLGGQPQLREDYETDNGNWIVDVSGLDLRSPEEMERTLDTVPGVLECGIFAARRADVLILGTRNGVRRLTAEPSEGRNGQRGR